MIKKLSPILLLCILSVLSLHETFADDTLESNPNIQEQNSHIPAENIILEFNTANPIKDNSDNNNPIKDNSDNNNPIKDNSDNNNNPIKDNSDNNNSIKDNSDNNNSIKDNSTHFSHSPHGEGAGAWGANNETINSPSHEAISDDTQPATNTICPESPENWFNRIFARADRTTLSHLFEKEHYQPPRNSYALIAPIRVQNGMPCLEYYSYQDSAFEYSMTPEGEENFWPASTVKLMAAVLALVKLRDYNLSSQAAIQLNDAEGHYEGTVQNLCREAIIPSNNTAYNRLIEIAGFDETNDDFLVRRFHFPTMLFQRRYVRNHPEDSLRTSPAILYRENDLEGLIPLRTSTGRMRHFCPRESNCTTLAELAEVMMRVVLHHEIPENYRFPVLNTDADMLIQALKEAPSCIEDGVQSVLGEDAVIYNKGGKVIGDDRLEVAVVTSRDGSERYLLALSMPYYEGVETETNELARQLILAMKALENHS